MMNRIEEFDRIVELLNLPHGRQLFRLKECKIRYLELEILPNPGGRFLITCPFEYPEKKPKWVVTIGDRLFTCLNVRVPASTILQAFMFGTFVIMKWLGEEMVLDVIQLDPHYYDKLLEEPEDAVISYSIFQQRIL
ncbi:unnamed protein product [Hymenolepis diminuta]|uniref:UBC core domain-containing protein n=1 Tax=Hymenolepis diminuta TaxID=6216 RepID=A0A0R3S874_HYMDI|nr:unnamed protein product [Hymenolepis diminuta]VUZ50577.1 unnamed protein product [Hymenolepis diminuta]